MKPRPARARFLSLALALAGVIGGLASARPDARQSRDTREIASSSTLTGTVVSADDGRPIARALVTVSGAVPAFSRIASTDAQGRFVFANLPAGNVTLTATKTAYLKTYYGSRRPDQCPAVPFEVGGTSASDVTVRLVHGAVIAGTVVGPTGRPQSGVSLAAIESRVVAGKRLLAAARGRSVDTDDRGRYRIWGLPPGEYVVTAVPPDVVTSRQSIVESDSGHVIRFAPIYYGNTADLANAVTVSIGAGEARDGVDLALRPMATAEIRGTLVGIDGQPAQGRMVALGGSIEATNATDAAGRFAFHSVPPGSVTISVRDHSPNGDLWASLDLSVNGVDQSGLTLVLQPGMTASGRVIFDGPSAATEDRSRAVISLTTNTQFSGATFATQARADSDGKFALSGLVPGRYQPRAAVLPTSSEPAGASWVVRSVLWRGQDLLDTGLVITPGQDLDGLTVVFTDRRTELNGTLYDTRGRPVAGYVVVVLPADRRFWTPESRRIGNARLDAGGRYDFTGLPAGDYLLAAVTELSAEDLQDPAWLDAVASMSLRLTLAEGEHKTQDLRLGK